MGVCISSFQQQQQRQQLQSSQRLSTPQCQKFDKSNNLDLSIEIYGENKEIEIDTGPNVVLNYFQEVKTSKSKGSKRTPTSKKFILNCIQTQICVSSIINKTITWSIDNTINREFKTSIIPVDANKWYRTEAFLYYPECYRDFGHKSSSSHSYNNKFIKVPSILNYTKYDGCYEIRPGYALWMLDSLLKLPSTNNYNASFLYRIFFFLYLIEYNSAWSNKSLHSLSWNQQLRRLRVALWYTQNYLAENIQSSNNVNRLHTYVETNEFLKIPVEQGGLDGVCLGDNLGVIACNEDLNTAIFDSAFNCTTGSIINETKQVKLYNELECICDGLIWKQMLIKGSTWRRPTTSCVATIEFTVIFKLSSNISEVLDQTWETLRLSLRSYSGLFMKITKFSDSFSIIKAIQELLGADDPDFSHFCRYVMTKCKCNEQVLSILCASLLTVMRLGARTLAKDEVASFSMPFIDQYLKCVLGDEKILLLMKMKEWIPVVPLYNNINDTIPSAFIRLSHIEEPQYIIYASNYSVQIDPCTSRNGLDPIKFSCNSELLTRLPKVLTDAIKLLRHDCKGKLYIVPSFLSEIFKSVDASISNDIKMFIQNAKGQYLDICLFNSKETKSVTNDLLNPYDIISSELTLLQERFVNKAKQILENSSSNSSNAQAIINKIRDSSKRVLKNFRRVLEVAERNYFDQQKFSEVRDAFSVMMDFSNQSSVNQFQNYNVYNPQFYTLIYPNTFITKIDDIIDINPVNEMDSYLTYDASHNFSSCNFLFYSFIYNTPLIDECSAILDNNFIGIPQINSLAQWLEEFNVTVLSDLDHSENKDTIFCFGDYTSLAKQLESYIILTKELMSFSEYGYTTPLFGIFELNLRKSLIVPLSSFQINYQATYESWCIHNSNNTITVPQTPSEKHIIDSNESRLSVKNEEIMSFTAYISRLYYYEHAYSAGATHLWALGKIILEHHLLKRATIQQMINFMLNICNKSLYHPANKIRLLLVNSKIQQEKLEYTVISPFASTHKEIFFNNQLHWLIYKKLNWSSTNINSNINKITPVNSDKTPMCPQTNEYNYDRKFSIRDTLCNFSMVIYVSVDKPINVDYISVNIHKETAEIMESIRKQIDMSIDSPCQILLNYETGTCKTLISNYFYNLSRGVLCALFSSNVYQYIFVIMPSNFDRKYRLEDFGQPHELIEIMRENLFNFNKNNKIKYTSNKFKTEGIVDRIIHIIYNEVAFEVPNENDSGIHLLRPWSLKQISLILKLLAERFHLSRSVLLWQIYFKLSKVSVMTKFEQRVLNCVIITLLCKVLRKVHTFAQRFQIHFSMDVITKIPSTLISNTSGDKVISEILQLTKVFLLFSMAYVDVCSLEILDSFFSYVKYIPLNLVLKYVKLALVQKTIVHTNSTSKYHTIFQYKTNINCVNILNKCEYLHALSVWLFGVHRTSIYQRPVFFYQLSLNKTAFNNILQQFQPNFNFDQNFKNLLTNLSVQANTFTYVQNRFYYLIYVWNLYSKPNLPMNSQFYVKNLHELLVLSFECLWLFDAWIGFQSKFKYSEDCKKPADKSQLLQGQNKISELCSISCTKKHNSSQKLDFDSSNKHEKNCWISEKELKNTLFERPQNLLENTKKNVSDKNTQQNFDDDESSNKLFVCSETCVKEWHYLYNKIEQVLTVCNSLLSYKKKRVDTSYSPNFLLLYYIVNGLFHLNFKYSISDFRNYFKKALDLSKESLSNDNDFIYTFNTIILPSMNTADTFLDGIDQGSSIILFIASMLTKLGYLENDLALISESSTIFRQILINTPICPFNIYPPLLYPEELETEYSTIHKYANSAKQPKNISLETFNAFVDNICLQNKSKTEYISDEKKINILQWYITRKRYDSSIWFESISFPSSAEFMDDQIHEEKTFDSVNKKCKEQIVLSIGSNVPYGSLGIGLPSYLKHNEQLYTIMPEYITENHRLVNGGIDIWWTNQFVEIVSLRNKIIKHIAAGEYHAIVVTATNDIYTWGNNRYGQCGLPNEESNLEEKKKDKYVEQLPSNLMDIDRLRQSSFYDDVFAYTKTSSYNSLMHNTINTNSNDKLNSSDTSNNIKLSKYGTVYRFSHNIDFKYDTLKQVYHDVWHSGVKLLAQLLSERKFKYVPLYLPWETYFIDDLLQKAKSNNHFEVFKSLHLYEISRPRPSTIRTMSPYATDCVPVPSIINNFSNLENVKSSQSFSNLLSSTKISNIVCGANFTVLVTTEGLIYTWGSNLDGCLGNASQDKCSWQPKCLSAKLITEACLSDYSDLLDRFEKSSVENEPNGDISELWASDILSHYYARRISSAKMVSCGPLHICVTDHEGGLWVWGRGDGGQLGVPYPLLLSPNHQYLNIGCTYPYRLRVFVRVIDISSSITDIAQLYKITIINFLYDIKISPSNEKALKCITCRPSNDQKTLIFTTTDAVLLLYSKLSLKEILENPYIHPTEILFEKVACGEAHTLSVGRPAGALQFQMLFTWGQCLYGQLGIQTTDAINEVDVIKSSDAIEKSSPQFTCQAFDLSLLLKATKLTEQNLSTFHITYENDSRTTPCLILNNYIDTRDNIIVLQAGGCSNFMILFSGKACVWGSNDFQVLGFPDSKFHDLQKPRLMSIYPSKKFRNGYFAMGASRLFLVTTNYELLCIGKDLFGASGHFLDKMPPKIFQDYQAEASTKQPENIWKPIKISNNIKVEKVASGAAFSIFVGVQDNSLNNTTDTEN